MFNRIGLGALGLVFLVPGALLGMFWETFYWRHRDCIEAAWRNGANGCFVPEETLNYSGNAAVLGWPALILLTLAAACFWKAVTPWHRTR